MSRAAFTENKEFVSSILNKMGDKTFRIFEAPLSYYQMRRLEKEGFVEHTMLNETNDRGHALMGWKASKKGRSAASRWTRQPRQATAH